MFEYDSAKIASRELPIWSKAVGKDTNLWSRNSARSFCTYLENQTDIGRFNFTAEELNNIQIVADGGMWPVPDEMYTNEDWGRDGTLNAVAGQEIEDAVYFAMFNVLPPYSLPHCDRTEEYIAGFLCSEPDCSDPLGRGELYNAFGRKGNGKYYYIGLLPRNGC